MTRKFRTMYLQQLKVKEIVNACVTASTAVRTDRFTRYANVVTDGKSASARTAEIIPSKCKGLQVGSFKVVSVTTLKGQKVITLESVNGCKVVIDFANCTKRKGLQVWKVATRLGCTVWAE